LGTAIFPRIVSPHPIINRRLPRKNRENRKYIKRSNRGRTKAAGPVKFPSLQFFPLSIFGFFIYALLIRETFNPMCGERWLSREKSKATLVNRICCCVLQKKSCRLVYGRTRELSQQQRRRRLRRRRWRHQRRRVRCTCSCLISDTTAAPECMCLLSVAALLSPLSGMRLHY
jgi:hypothetical protein